jgi:hypothetical protein
MKLICCVTCSEVFSLSKTYRECSGGHGGGQYLNNLDAKVWGDPHTIFTLGFANQSLISALRSQTEKGDLPADFNYGGKTVSKGRSFEAFVIPNSASSVTRVLEKFDPIVLDKSSRPY